MNTHMNTHMNAEPMPFQVGLVPTGFAQSEVADTVAALVDQVVKEAEEAEEAEEEQVSRMREVLRMQFGQLLNVPTNKKSRSQRIGNIRKIWKLVRNHKALFEAHATRVFTLAELALLHAETWDMGTSLTWHRSSRHDREDKAVAVMLDSVLLPILRQATKDEVSRIKQALSESASRQLWSQLRTVEFALDQAEVHHRELLRKVADSHVAEHIRKHLYTHQIDLVLPLFVVLLM